MQWGRVLPVSDNTGLHCLSWLFSEHGSFSTQTRSSSRVVFVLGKGRAKRLAICHLHGPNLPHLCTPSSPASLEQTLRYLSFEPLPETLNLKPKAPKNLPMRQISWLCWTLWIQMFLNGEAAQLIRTESSKATMPGQSHCLLNSAL